MKKKLFLLTSTVSLILTSSVINAGTMGEMQVPTQRAGWVVGGDIGYGYLGTQEEDLFPPAPLTTPALTERVDQNHRIGSLVGGIYAGRDYTVFNRLLMGYEIGYKYLGQSKYHSYDNDFISGFFIRTDIQVQQQAVDLLLTGKVALWQNLNLIGKAGAAYVHSRTEQDSSFNIGSIAGALSTDATIWRLKPELGVGLGYTFTSNIGINLMYTYIGGVDTNVTGLYRFFNTGPDKTPAVFQYNGLTAGLSYTFG